MGARGSELVEVSVSAGGLWRTSVSATTTTTWKELKRLIRTKIGVLIRTGVLIDIEIGVPVLSSG